MSKYTFVFIIALLLAACSGSDDEEDFGISGCSTVEQNEFVHRALQDRYFWYREIDEVVNYSDFASPQETLQFLKFTPLDRFSSITTVAAFDSLFEEGEFLGYGFSFSLDTTNEIMLIKFTNTDSPSGRAGMTRGDRILSINGNPIEQIIPQISSGEIFGESLEGEPIDMRLRHLDGTEDDIHMEKEIVNINTVLFSDVIEDGTDRIAYLVFNSFLETSRDELDQVFSEFKAKLANKLILDLRYNGGGLVSVANTLASLIKRNNGQAELFGELRKNDKHQDDTSRFFLENLSNSLGLDEVTIITTRATASASEMIINGLKPYINVKQIGDTTFGKPVGQNGFEFCDNLLLPITFAIFNADDEGDYFDGISADCAANDDLNFAFGDLEEPMLKAALDFTQNLNCPAAKSTATTYPADIGQDGLRQFYNVW